MRTRIVIFLCALGLIPALFFLLPKRDWSPEEKRYLASRPKLSLSSLADGSFGEETETYVSERFPGRNFFVELNAYAEKLCLRQTTKEIYAAADGALIERPVTFDEELARRRTEIVNAFAEKTGREVTLCVIPSAGYVRGGSVTALADSYRDDELLEAISAAAEENVRTVDLLPAFLAAEGELFYKTDHHWTSRGAHLAAGELFAERRGKLPENFTVTATEDFRGTTRSRAAFWNVPGERLELWDGGGSFTVTDSESGQVHAGIFYPEKLESDSPYDAFLNGNRPLVTIENGDPEAEGTLLLIRDSYADTLAGFAAYAYKTVILVDLRYYKKPVSELAAEADDVMLLYSLKNFMEEESLVLLD